MTPSAVKTDESRTGPEAERVRLELHRVVESAAFRGSHRCTGFLEFVVNRALQGDADSLKERTLAVEIFGRNASSDLTDDSIVRVGAREVRKRLAQYYVEEGAHDPIRISLPAGSYVPVFQEADSKANSVEAVPPAKVSAPAISRPRRFRPWLVALAAVLLAASVAAAWLWAKHPSTDFDAFWQPAFNQTTPIVIAMAHPLVYHPDTRANLLTDQRDGPVELPFQRPVNVDLLRGSDFVPVFDQYTGFGDTVAAIRLAVLFTQHSRAVRVRLASKLDFNDLRDSATILVGAYTNRWTTELTRDFRYRFEYTRSRQPCIVDSADGRKRWEPVKNDNGSSNEDYIVIGRLPNSQTGRCVIIGAGLTQYGTEEAGRILADSDALNRILKRLPANWRQKNLELVLHSKIVGDAPMPPELEAWNVW
jgi:hypothetical protein